MGTAVPKVLIVSASDLSPVLGDTVLWGKDVERVFTSSSSAVLDVARAFVPSLLVLDGDDALATAGLIRQLREHPGTRRSSIVVLSSCTAPPGDPEILKAGANLALHPPVDPAVWDARLAKLLAVPRRLRTRFPVRLQVDGSEATLALAGEVLDLSETGMLVETESALERGSRLALRFTLPGASEELRGTASVARSSQGAPARLGLCFRRMEGDAVERIRELLASAPVVRAFGRYEVLGPLGEGSMGRVYRGFDPVAQRVVAIKTLKPELLASVDAEEYARRFRREAQAAAKLVHPSIVTLFDVGDDYFVMELLEGTTLQSVLRERGRLDPAVACRILEPVAEALDYAHSMGTIHRDVKPANIMIPPDGRPKVMDFGVAHLVSGSITAGGQVFGSPAYMAPEQITRSEVSPQSDVFSLAVIAYEALTGRKPFEGVSVTPILYHVVNTEPPLASRCNPALGSRHDQALQRALSKDPAARFDTATAFVRGLESGVTEGPSPAIVTGASGRAEPADPADPGVETLELGPDARAGRFGPSRWRGWAWAGALSVAILVATLSRRAAPPPAAAAAPKTPGLAITTTPPGAKVWLDGVLVGTTTPLFLSNVPAAAHQVRVAAEGYVPAEMSVRTTEGDTAMPLRFILQPATGALEVDSDPAPATVRVDGEVAGETPLSHPNLPPGTHRVLVERPGYRPFSRAVDVSSGATERLTARLERSTEELSGQDSLRQKGWVRVGDFVTLGPGVTPPWRIQGRAARYPEAARKHHIEGTVAVALTVSETGDVLDARVVESAGELLDEALLAAVRGWRYQPAESNGVKVRVRIVERQGFPPPS